MWKCCKNIVNVTLFFLKKFLPRFWQPQFFFLFFYSHFQKLGCHNSYFLSPQFPTISATWLLQLVNHSGTPTGALHRQSLDSGMNFDNTITKIHFFSLLITSLNFFLSHTFSYNFGNGIAEIQSLSSFY